MELTRPKLFIPKNNVKPVLDNPKIKDWLSGIVDRATSEETSRLFKTNLGRELGKLFRPNNKHESVLIIAVADDADYLVTGYIEELKEKGVDYKFAIFWNHHYSLPDGRSIAPITQII